MPRSFEGHLSSALCHLGNTSYRLGKQVPFSQETKALGDDKAAYEALESMKEHLADAAKLKLADSTYRLGRQLEYDAKSREVRRRRRGQQADHRALPRTVRGAGERIVAVAEEMQCPFSGRRYGGPCIAAISRRAGGC